MLRISPQAMDALVRSAENSFAQRAQAFLATHGPTSARLSPDALAAALRAAHADGMRSEQELMSAVLAQAVLGPAVLDRLPPAVNALAGAVPPLQKALFADALLMLAAALSPGTAGQPSMTALAATAAEAAQEVMDRAATPGEAPRRLPAAVAQRAAAVFGSGLVKAGAIDTTPAARAVAAKQQQFSQEQPGGVSMPCRSYRETTWKHTGDDWIEVLVRDEAGHPWIGTVTMTLTDGRVVMVDTDEHGLIRYDAIPSGSCVTALPKVDAPAWALA